MTLVNSQVYVSRLLGGQNDTGLQSRALEAIGNAMEDLQNRHDWSFFLVDTAQPFTVASCTGAGTTMTTVTTDGFKDVLVGMTVTGTGVPASTTVTAKASSTSLTTSAATTISAQTATFGGTIPIIAGTDQYTLPARFWKPYSCRLVSSGFRRLMYVNRTDVDTIWGQQTVQGYVHAYSIYNGADFDASSTQQTKIQFFQVPNAADVALLKYYRAFDITKTTLDVDDNYLYTLLNLARVKLLMFEDATNARLPMLANQAEIDVRRAIASDTNQGGEDELERFRTAGELGAPGVVVGYPRGDFPWAS
jgi:hypothetical protein